MRSNGQSPHLTVVGPPSPNRARTPVNDGSRADHLRRLADRLERNLGSALLEYGHAAWSGPRAELGLNMLDRNLEQIRRAARQLRAAADGVDQPDPAA